MEGVILLLLLLVFGVPITLFVWIGTKASRADRSVRELEVNLNSLRLEVQQLRNELQGRATVAANPPAAVIPTPKVVASPLASPVQAPPAPPLIVKPPLYVPESAPPSEAPGEDSLTATEEPATFGFYHFIGVLPAFGLMVLVTALAFLVHACFTRRLLGLRYSTISKISLATTGKSIPYA